jgi:hypothetical protein
MCMVIDPASRRLAWGVLRQGLADARAGRPVSISALTAWGLVAGMKAENVAAVFDRVRSGDPAMLAAVRELGKARKRVKSLHVSGQQAESQRRRWARASPEQRRAYARKIIAGRAANGR